MVAVNSQQETYSQLMLGQPQHPRGAAAGVEVAPWSRMSGGPSMASVTADVKAGVGRSFQLVVGRVLRAACRG